MKFHQWDCLCDGSNLKAGDFYSHALAMMKRANAQGRHLFGSSSDDIVMGNRFLLEDRYTRAGRPYCKIFPGIASMLLEKQKLDIPMSRLRFDLSVLELRLAKPVTVGNIAAVDSILIGTFGGHFAAFSQLEGDTDGACGPLMTFAIDRGLTFEEALSNLAIIDRPTGECERALLSFCVGAYCFVEFKHKLVMPDLEPRIILHPPPKHHKKRRHVHAHESAAKLTLGKEMELPPPIHGYIPSGDKHRPLDGESGRELHRSHVRRWHWRLQAYGPRDNPTHELIVIPETIVRPDLPSPIAFRIPDPEAA
jgi:hypothetical protein